MPKILIIVLWLGCEVIKILNLFFVSKNARMYGYRAVSEIIPQTEILKLCVKVFNSCMIPWTWRHSICSRTISLKRCSKNLNDYKAILATFLDPRYNSSFFSNHAPDEEEEKYQKANPAGTEAKLRNTKKNVKQLQAAENSDTMIRMSPSDEEFAVNNERQSDESNLDWSVLWWNYSK